MSKLREMVKRIIKEETESVDPKTWWSELSLNQQYKIAKAFFAGTQISDFGGSELSRKLRANPSDLTKAFQKYKDDPEFSYENSKKYREF